MLYITPTIDVEGVHGDRPFDQLVLGDVGKADTWGVYRIAEILKTHGCAGTFFVDVYEYTLWGEEPVAEVCKRLVGSGHDVQLHTHPGWRVDPRDKHWLQELKKNKSFLSSDQDFMAKLTLDEQEYVLRHGKEMLEKWTGQKVIAHRGGGYSVDSNTIEALSRVAIPVDSSMNSAHENSKLTWAVNQVCEKNGILEFPITVGKLFPPGIPHKTNWAGRITKTDFTLYGANGLIDWILSAKELGVTFLNLFFHSYSLLEFDWGYSRIRPSEKRAKDLGRFFERVQKIPDVKVLSIRDIYNEYKRGATNLKGSDALPTATVPLRAVVLWAGRRLQNSILS